MCEHHAQALGLREFARSEKVQWTGIAVSRTGRVFVNSPHWHEGHGWSVAEILPDGALKPFPDAVTNQWRAGDDVSSKFVCVQSVFVDDQDRLWVLDPGNPKFQGVIPGAAKLVRFDLAAPKSAAWSLAFSEQVAPKDSYLNDVRVDTSRQFAYVSDSGRGGVVVIDLRSGQSWRRLDGHPSVLAEPIVPTIEGRELRWGGGDNAGQVPQVHSDGIALSPDGDYLYYQALTARTLYRIPTSVLRDRTASAEQVAVAVENLGSSVMTDGMIMDARGTIYFSALEKDAIVTRSPDGSFATLVQDPRIAWPDSFAIGPNSTLYFTTAQIHRTAWFNTKSAMQTEPYLVFTHPLAK
jgi:sugar lactone lactonase YvrE